MLNEETAGLLAAIAAGRVAEYASDGQELTITLMDARVDVTQHVDRLMGDGLVYPATKVNRLPLLLLLTDEGADLLEQVRGIRRKVGGSSE